MNTKQTIDGVPREFVREGRYIVVKPDYEDDLRTERLRNYIEEMCFHTPDCVVVEADWPEYEKVWGMIEARVSGHPTELDAAQATIAHLRDDLDGTRILAADQRLTINRLQARISELESAQPQGEPVAWRYHDDAGTSSWFGGAPEKTSLEFVGSRGGRIERAYAKQPAPVAVVLPERSTESYAIEHAEYMAKSADDVLVKFQTYGLALLAVDEGGDDGEGELFEAIDSARQDLQESLVDLRGMVYEFRKRSNRCTPL
jgi:hypothetical protein